MADPTQAELQTELDEVNAQLREMVGAADFSVAGFSVSESQLQADLKVRKRDLEWAINKLANGSTSGSGNMTSISSSGGY